jgi:hypothetical protein
MQDVLLEPYGGEILGLSVSATTLLTATMGGWRADRLSPCGAVAGAGDNPYRMGARGILIGLAAFSAVIFSNRWGFPSAVLRRCGLIGFGGGLFSVATLTAAMTMPAAGKAGAGLRWAPGARRRRPRRGCRSPSAAASATWSTALPQWRPSGRGAGQPGDGLFRRLPPRDPASLHHAGGPRAAGADGQRPPQPGDGQDRARRPAHLTPSPERTMTWLTHSSATSTWRQPVDLAVLDLLRAADLLSSSGEHARGLPAGNEAAPPLRTRARSRHLRQDLHPAPWPGQVTVPSAGTRRRIARKTWRMEKVAFAGWKRLALRPDRRSAGRWRSGRPPGRRARTSRS